MKPYQKIPIVECHEPLVAIPGDRFVLPEPSAYAKIGADYGGKSPYYLRQGVLEALIGAQNYLQQDYPRWRLLIFDAYRPVEVQQFMVDYTWNQILKTQGLKRESLSNADIEEIYRQVYQIWAVPSLDPATPPPHSTGAAVDITLVNEKGEILDMGGEIDELSERSYPNYYENSQDEQGRIYHQRRGLLHQTLKKAGFQRHLGEWWHFSRGDQLWAWLSAQENPHNHFRADYGRIEV